MVRQACVRALGRTGLAGAMEPLLEAWPQTGCFGWRRRCVLLQVSTLAFGRLWASRGSVHEAAGIAVWTWYVPVERASRAPSGAAGPSGALTALHLRLPRRRVPCQSQIRHCRRQQQLQFRLLPSEEAALADAQLHQSRDAVLHHLPLE